MRALHGGSSPGGVAMGPDGRVFVTEAYKYIPHAEAKTHAVAPEVITALLAQNAIGQSARATHPAALSRLAPPDDYVPPLSTAEVYLDYSSSYYYY